MSKKIRRDTSNQRKNTKFGQDRRRHSKRGVTSCLFAVMGLSILLGVFFVAYVDYGKGNTIIGALAVILLILNCAGVSIGLKGFKERQKNYIACKFGVGANVFIILCLLLLYIRGLA